MTTDVELKKTNGKLSLEEFFKTDEYPALKDKIKADILKDPRLHSLHEMFLLFESLDQRLARIENQLLDLEVRTL